MKINPKLLLYSFLGALPLLAFALYNGYPIVYSDTSTYLSSGFALETPFDRPITYGLFIRLFSMNGLTLWTVVLTQSWMLSFLILLLYRDFMQASQSFIYFLVSMIFLSGLTVLSFVASQVITDSFVAIGLLSMLHLVLNRNLGKFNTILIFILYTVANAMHMSHLVFNTFMLGSVFMIYRLFFRNRIAVSYRNILLLLIFTFLGILPMGSSLAKSKHVFFVGRMAQNGILIRYLKDNCEKNQYRLCNCIDSIPGNTTDFLWDPSSPLNTRYQSWDEAGPDFTRIIRGTLFRPEYLILHIRESLKNTTFQLITFDAGDGTGPFVEGTKLYERIQRYIPREAAQYRASKQSREYLSETNLQSISQLYRWIVVLAIGILVLDFSFVRFRFRISAIHRFIVILCLFGIFLNSALNASLVVLTDRFGAKMIWMIPFLVLILLPNLIGAQRPLNSHQQPRKTGSG